MRQKVNERAGKMAALSAARHCKTVQNVVRSARVAARHGRDAPRIAESAGERLTRGRTAEGGLVMRTHCFRLERGDDLRASIGRYARAHGLDAAVVAACPGCLLRARLRDASGVTEHTLDERLEIVSLTGTVSKERLHLHISLAREDLSVIGGHLLDGCVVNTTAEVVLLELDGVRFLRAFDPGTGYGELQIVLNEEPIKGEQTP